jgi:hypothetical protein
MKKPKLEEIDFYCRLQHPKVDPIAFFLHYESNGWYVGKVPMKNWRAAVANWDRMQQTKNGGTNVSKREQEFAAAIERSREDDRPDESVQRISPRSGSRVCKGIQAHGGGVWGIESQPGFKFGD